jgi:hypothetical protein
MSTKHFILALTMIAAVVSVTCLSLQPESKAFSLSLFGFELKTQER